MILGYEEIDKISPQVGIRGLLGNGAVIYNTLRRSVIKRGRLALSKVPGALLFESATYYYRQEVCMLTVAFNSVTVCDFRKTVLRPNSRLVFQIILIIIRVSIAPYGRNFRGAGGRSDQCSVKA